MSDQPQEPPMPLLPGPTSPDEATTLIQAFARLVGWRVVYGGDVGLNLRDARMIMAPETAREVQHQVDQLRSAKAAVDELRRALAESNKERDHLRAAIVDVQKKRDEAGKLARETLNELQEARDELDKARKNPQTLLSAEERRGLEMLPYLDAKRAEYLRGLNETRLALTRARADLQEARDELDEVTEILSHGVDQPGSPIEMARVLLERATRAEDNERYAAERLREEQRAAEMGRTVVREHLSDLASALSRGEAFAALWSDLQEVMRRHAVEPISFKRDQLASGVEVTFDGFLRHKPGALEVETGRKPEPTLKVVSKTPLAYATAGASGIDLPLAEGARISCGQTRRLKTGVRVQIPEGYEGQIRPRSSASARGLYVALGTIDSDYRGEIEIIARNERNADGELLGRGECIAQLVIAPVARLPIVQVEALDETERGEGGFGSTTPKG